MTVLPTPAYYQTPWSPIVENLSTANTNRTVSGITGLTALGAAAGPEGRYVDSVVFYPTGNTTAGVVRVWRRPGDTGDGLLVGEAAVSAQTASATVAQTPTIVAIGLNIPSGDRVYISSQTADAWNVVGVGRE